MLKQLIKSGEKYNRYCISTRVLPRPNLRHSGWAWSGRSLWPHQSFWLPHQEIWILKAWGAAMLKGPRENTEHTLKVVSTWCTFYIALLSPHSLSLAWWTSPWTWPPSEWLWRGSYCEWDGCLECRTGIDLHQSCKTWEGKYIPNSHSTATLKSRCLLRE